MAELKERDGFIIEKRYTRDWQVPLVADDPEMNFGWQNIPLPPDFDAGWEIFDTSSDKKTGWRRVLRTPKN